jgi:putative DNA primase/helicase
MMNGPVATMETPMLDAALDYYARGWSIIPVGANKRPLVNWKQYQQHRVEIAPLREWFDCVPSPNIAIVTGAVSNIVVLDVDAKSGGLTSLERLQEQHGRLPDTVAVSTGGGGRHIYFTHPGKEVPSSAGKLGPGLDVRGDGGYVVAPPSKHESGQMYEWEGIPQAALQPLPDWLLWLLVDTLKQTSRLPHKPGTIPEGARNQTLTSLAGTMRRRTFGYEAILQALLAENQERCEPPLQDEEVERIARSVARYEPAPEDCATDDPGRERYTDMANATRLADEAAGHIAHVEEMKDKWYVYDGARLNLMAKTAVIPFVKAVARRLYEEAAELNEDAQRKQQDIAQNAGNLAKGILDAKSGEIEAIKERADRRRAGAMRLESRDGCYAAIELAKAEPRLHVELNQIDAHPTWLNTPTGTIDLLTGEMWGHRFGDYLTRVTTAAYDPVARCPSWEAFLADVIPSQDVRSFIQRSVGLTLTDISSEQCLWFLYGLGRNGKTTFLNAIRSVLGDYAAAVPASTLMVKSHGDDKRNDVARLRGARFVAANEAEDGQQMAEALIKQLTGEDPITVRFLYAEFFEFKPTFKIFLAANHKPAIRGQDIAMWRRIHVVPFTQTIPLDKVDKGLPSALAAEASGILNWAIAGFKAWQSGGLRPPHEVSEATEAYKDESDPLGEFFDEYTVKDPDGSVLARNLYAAYKAWTDSNGVRFPMTQQTLGRQLQGRGFTPGRLPASQGKGRVWFGLGLRNEQRL